MAPRRSPARRWRAALHARYGLDYVGLRYMNVYGPRQDYHGAYIAVIMKMLDAIDRGEPVVLFGDGSQAYDFVYVGDCADANRLRDEGERHRSVLQRRNRHPHLAAGAGRARPEGHRLRRREFATSRPD